MENINITNWLKYTNEWLLNNKMSSSLIKRPRFLHYKFRNYDKSTKNKIKEILLKKDNIEIISKPYNNNNNLILIEQLNSIISSQINFDYLYYIYDKTYITENLISHKYIITYYLFFCDNSIIEQIHWTYYRIDFLIILIEKKISIKKILEIINWNFIYNSKVLSIFTEYYFNKYNFTNYIMIKEYILSLYSKNDLECKYSIYLPSKYNLIVKNLNNYTLNNMTCKINFTNSNFIKELILYGDDKTFIGLLNKTKPKIMLNSICLTLTKSNIKEKNILKFVNLCIEKKKAYLFTYNYKLFAKLLSSGYFFTIDIIWSKNILPINYQIYNVIKKIIINDTNELFELLVKSKILYKYLFDKTSRFYTKLWLDILILGNSNISKILFKYKYKIPTNIMYQLEKYLDYDSRGWKSRMYKNNYNLKNNYQNFISNLNIFDIPISQNLLKILFKYFSDEQIITHINTNIKRINIDEIVYLILDSKKYNLIQKLFDIYTETIFNEKIFIENISKYTKDIKNKNTLANIYSYCIKKFNTKSKNKYIIFALKYKQINLLKLILKKQKYILNPNLIIKYFFKVNLVNENVNTLWYCTKDKNLFIKLYLFMKKNIKNWNQIYKSNIVSRLILEKLEYVYEDYLEIMKNNIVINLNIDEFITNKYVDYKLKIKVLTNYLEYLVNSTKDDLEYFDIVNSKVVTIEQSNINIKKTLEEIDNYFQTFNQIINLK